MTLPEFEDFRHEAVHELMALNQNCEELFHISVWSRWDYDLESSSLTFSDDTGPKVIASIVAVGTTATESNTWLWAWANESIPHQAHCRLATVQAFGEAENIADLTTDCLPDAEYLGWAMTAVSARILGAKGAYRCPDENGFLYLVYADVRILD